MRFKKFKSFRKFKLNFKLKFKLAIFTILILLTNQIFAQNSAELSQNKNSKNKILEKQLFGIELSNAIYNSLSKNNFAPRKISLSRTQENLFPYNISILIPKSENQKNENSDLKNSTENSNKKNSTKIQSQKNEFNSLLISFKQEEIFKNQEFLFDLIQNSTNEKYDFDITILLTACDNNLLLGNENLSGTESFSKLIEGAENIATILIDFSNTNLPLITPGAEKKVAPLWLTKLIISALEKNSALPKIKGSVFMSLYNLNIFQTEKDINSYLSKNIPATKLSINKNNFSDSEFQKIFQTIFSDFSNCDFSKNETHYIPIKLQKKYFWIEEEITIIFLLILIFSSLIIYCDLGFIFRKNHSLATLNTKRAVKIFYRIPISILLFLLCIELAQSVALLLNNSVSSSQEIIFFIKFAIAFILISLICLSESKVQKKATIATYNYFLKIASLANVFIFSAIDISLFYIFTLIYFITTISSYCKKTISFLIALALSILPYTFLIYEILSFTNIEFIDNLIFLNPIENFFIACLITPIFISYLKILTSLKKEISEKTDFKTTQKEIIAELKNKLYKNISKNFLSTQTILIFSILILTIYFGTKIRIKYEKNNIKISTEKNILEIENPNLLKTSYQDSNYYSGTNRQIFVKSKIKPYRTEIFVTGESENPVFYSPQTFEQSKNSNKVKFEIPDFPPENFSIFYTPDNSNFSTIEIFNYYELKNYPEEFLNFEKSILQNKTFIKEKSTITINLSNLSNVSEVR